MRTCVLCILLGCVGCGDEGTGSDPSPKPSLQPDGGSSPAEDPPAPAPDQRAPLADSRVASPEQGAAPGCPSAAQLAGGYAGSYTGTLQGTLPINLQGTVSFTLVASGNDLSIQNGKVSGAVLGVGYQLPMGGTVICGHLDGNGTGVIATVTLAGIFKASWTAGSFSDGTWSGQDAKKLSTASGTWNAARK